MTTTASLPAAWARLERRPPPTPTGARLLPRPPTGRLPPRPRLEEPAGPCSSATRPAGRPAQDHFHADPRKRWRCLFVDEIDHVAATEPASDWATADNYNPTHPFHAIDEVSVAI